MFKSLLCPNTCIKCLKFFEGNYWKISYSEEYINICSKTLNIIQFIIHKKCSLTHFTFWTAMPKKLPGAVWTRMYFFRCFHHLPLGYAWCELPVCSVICKLTVEVGRSVFSSLVTFYRIMFAFALCFFFFFFFF